MNLKLRTLTPLHVGDGSTLHPFDYTILDGRFYRCSPRFFELLLEKLGEDAGEKFVRWSGDIMDRMEAASKDNRVLSRIEQSRTLKIFARSIGQERQFDQFLLDKAPWIPLQNGDSKTKFRGFARAADGQVYLPGSSLKGCIRTALLYHFLEEYHSHNDIQKILQDNITRLEPLTLTFKRKVEPIVNNYNFLKSQPQDCQTERKMKECEWRIKDEKRALDKKLAQPKKDFGIELEHLAFFAGMKNKEGKPSPKEAQDDLMRCVIVSDTYSNQNSMGVENVDLYLIKKQPKNKGGGFKSSVQTQTPGVEAILPNTELNVQLDFNVELLLQLHHRAGDNGVQVGDEIHFIGWRKRVEVLFNLTEEDFNSVPKGATSEHEKIKTIRQKALNHIIECCRSFSDAQAVKYRDWLDKYGASSDDNAMRQKLEDGASAVFSATGARMHLGFSTGFEGITIVMHLVAMHKNLFREVMNIFGIGDSPSAKRSPGDYYESNPDRFPTSRRLATRPGAIVPLGWLEWAEDPLAGPVRIAAVARNIENETIAAPSPALPAAPVFLRGTLKQGAELDAELLAGGNPGRFKLFIRQDYMPEVEIKYAAGFKVEDVGRIARLLVKNIGKTSMIVDFVRYK